MCFKNISVVSHPSLQLCISEIMGKWQEGFRKQSKDSEPYTQWNGWTAVDIGRKERDLSKS